MRLLGRGRCLWHQQTAQFNAVLISYGSWKPIVDSRVLAMAVISRTVSEALDAQLTAQLIVAG